MRTVIEMASEARLAFNFDDYPDIWATFMNVGREEIEAFAALIRADEQKKWEGQTMIEINEAVIEEREACAKVCDIEASVIVTNAAEQYQEGRSMGAAVCAAAIRARGIK